MGEARVLTPEETITSALTTPAEARTVAESRAKSLELEAAMLALPEHQIQIETRHYFGPCTYMREIIIPKDAMLTGKIQKTEYLNILSRGDISVMTEDGIKRVRAPAVLRSYPGLKRAGYAHEETVWLTVHQNPDNERDIDKLEDRLFADSFEGLPLVMEKRDDTPQVTFQGREKNYDQVYFNSKRTLDDVCKALGVTREKMRQVSVNP